MGITLNYLVDEPPPVGELTPIVPGIRWLRMPLPFDLDHINLWVMDDGDGATAVDTGLASRESERIWKHLLETSLADTGLTRIVVTHFHPDHVGMAGWLAERTGAPIHMPQTEWLWTRLLCMDHGAETVDEVVEFSRRAGADQEYLDKAQQRGVGYHALVKPLPRQYQPLRNGGTLEIGGNAWRMVEGRGHAPEHACLFCEKTGVLIAGDQVLPRISPIVGVPMWEPDSDPLSDFLDTIERLLELPDDIVVLPSHGLPFRGLHPRLRDMAAHHDERLATTKEACATPLTAMQTVDVLFKRQLNHEHRGFALREAVAHLNYLMVRGEISRYEREDGVYLYDSNVSQGQ